VWTAKDGSRLLLRPICPEDEPALVTFHGTLSERSVALRYFHATALSARVAHERPNRICFIDYDREMALVAQRKNLLTGDLEILGVGRLSKVLGNDEAEFALLVSDRFQGQGFGTALLDRLLQIGRDERIARISGQILSENTEMQRVCEKLGFRLAHRIGDSVFEAVIDL
jgi:acetyltransferase